MNCRRARRSIPLLAGNDLSQSKARRMKIHLERCERCRKDFRAYSAALNKAKELADREAAPEWTDSEWRALMDRATSARIEKRPFVFSIFGIRPMTAVARGLAVAVPAFIIGLVLWNTILKPRPSPVVSAPAYVLKPEPVPPVPPSILQDKKAKKEPAVRSQEKTVIVAQTQEHKRPATRPEESAGAQKKDSQDVVSVTLVSQDTGLKVVWFLNRNFEWKGEGK